MENRSIAALMLLAVAFVYGCASDEIKEEGKAGVEERTPGGPGGPLVKPDPPRPPTGPIIVKPVTPDRTDGGNPLKDPANILSKRSIFYDYDSDSVKDEYRPLLQAHAKYLSQNRTAKMLIQGNCDERGSREYNIALGQRRADNVKRTLVLMGAAEAQIEPVSLGEEKPRCAAQTEECYSQNRRSDLLYGGEY